MLSISRNVTLISVLLISILCMGNGSFVSYADVTLNDSTLKAELVAKGLNSPTSMAFLSKDDMLILEKNGIVQRIVDSEVLKAPVLNISSIINNTRERGLLGIAISADPQSDNKDETDGDVTKIYLYFTQEISNNNTDNYCEVKDCGKDHRVVNSLYRYEMKDGTLLNPKPLINIPYGNDDIGIEHIGGAITIGSDKRIYITSGDGYPCRNIEDCKNSIIGGALNSKTANSISGSNASGLGGILVIPEDFKGYVDDAQVGQDFPSSLYYAYGIRNSFGLDFDPITGDLWDTENGPYFGDEINLVKPGFNSGWAKIQGIWPITDHSLLVKDLPEGYLFPKNSSLVNPNSLFDFNNIGKYSSPEFIWNDSIGVTAIKFYNSDKLGRDYHNDIFVGSYGKGFLYNFDLNKNRTGVLTEKIENNVADRNQLKPFIFGSGFFGVSDIEVSPDGLLYILSFSKGEIWRIVPAGTQVDNEIGN